MQPIGSVPADSALADREPSGKNIIEVKDVVKSFPVGDSEITILKGISFTVGYGEFVSIVGPSGNGKSTLLNMITGIDRPSSGEIMAIERPVHAMSENELAVWRGAQVGIIFQFFQMLPALSLVQNVILPMEFAGKYTKTERQERAMHLLDRVGLADQATKLPGMVSGGQQQRAAIARALANDPPLLIGDEPTGNLDSKTEVEVFDIFESFIASGKTMLMVTHSKSLADQAHRKIEIIDGHIASDTINSAAASAAAARLPSVVQPESVQPNVHGSMMSGPVGAIANGVY